ncbi:Fanconi anemia group F protein [Spea bombifrons]|uniref:Fanconi anemia group F protein n=1 Tax=Spea bombifrons TaxID=233779 RepID=UPI00234A314F|nr:Fanconi anemia group F protein [Spea bombifrons]
MDGKLKTMLENLDHFVEVLALSRSVHVKDWDVLSVRRALEWGAYFKHVHQRFQTSEAIKEVLEDHLRLKNGQLNSCMKNYNYIQFEDLGKCEEVLCTSLLQNKALPKDVVKYLLSKLKEECSTKAALSGVNHIIAQKAASRLLLSVLPAGGPRNPLEDPVVLTQAELLSTRLKDRIKTLEPDQQSAVALDLLSRISPPLVFHLLAVILVSEDDVSTPDDETALSQHLLEWLFVNDSTLSGFCSNLSCQTLTQISCKYPRVRKAHLDFLAKSGVNMETDISSGEWVGAELSFQMLLDHFRCLMAGSEDLKEATGTFLRTLKAQDGDYDVPGISLWTDLLLEISKT